MASDSNVYFDQRTYHRHLKSGRVTEAEYEAHLQGLPDAADNIMDPEEGGDDDGYEARIAAKNAPEEEEAAAAPAPADPFAPIGAPAAPVAPPVASPLGNPVAPPVPAPAVSDAPAPPPPPLEVPIGASPIIPPKVD